MRPRPGQEHPPSFSLLNVSSPKFSLGRMSPSERMKAIFRSDAAKLTMCVVGVVGTLMVYGVMQERIMRQPYGADQEKFQESLFIVLCNRILTCSLAVVVLLIQGKSMAPVAPLYSYAAVSVSNVVATGCQYEALKFVSFPIQTLAKSAKMIPVMIWGTAIMGKKYNLKDYIVALLVTAGCAIFVLYGDNKKHRQVDSTFWGVLLMVGYLAFDGFTSTFQDKLFKGYKMDTWNQILYISMWSALLSLLGLRYRIVYAIRFITKHPDCFFHIFMLSASATTSQFFISYTIKTFGALAFATIMTTRQLLSILLSSILYGPPLTFGQYGGTTMVFSSLYYKSYTNSKEKKAEAKSKESSSMDGDGAGKEMQPLIMSGGKDGPQQRDQLGMDGDEKEGKV
ncbi:hypothetical protein CLOM_g14616 [Closterium sp. NIES-68]|nr:hypothetical protein CLOM_g14616 [Closterium sp. NIES-68]GJP82459.1 hypothetical protein CLOP_g12718 [Closterium sp. NIES-67]